VCPVLSSSGVSPPQRLSEFSQSGADSRLHGSERLIQLPCRLFISEFREKCSFDRTSFFWSQDLKRIPQQAALLFKQTGLLRIDNVRCRLQAVRIRVHSFFSLIKPQAINRPAARLIHNPAADRSVSGIIGRGFSPHFIEYIERDFFGGFSIRGYPHDQRKNDSMRLLVKGMQGTLVTAGDGSDEL